MVAISVERRFFSLSLSLALGFSCFLFYSGDFQYICIICAMNIFSWLLNYFSNKPRSKILCLSVFLVDI